MFPRLSLGAAGPRAFHSAQHVPAPFTRRSMFPRLSLGAACSRAFDTAQRVPTPFTLHSGFPCLSLGAVNIDFNPRDRSAMASCVYHHAQLLRPRSNFVSVQQRERGKVCFRTRCLFWALSELPIALERRDKFQWHSFQTPVSLRKSFDSCLGCFHLPQGQHHHLETISNFTSQATRLKSASDQLQTSGAAPSFPLHSGGI